MKLLLISNSLGTGGAEKLLLDTIPKFFEQGITVDLLLLNGTRHSFYTELEQKNCCKIIDLGKGSVYNPFNIFKILPHLKKYSLVHVHLFPSLYWVGFAKMFSRAKIPLIYTEHSTENRRRKWYFKIADRIIYSQYHKIVTITDEVKNQLENHLQFENDKFLTIKNGVDIAKIEKASPIINGEFESFQNKIKILQVSRFQFPKDQATLIRSMTLLPENYHLFLVGDGANLEACENLVKSLKLSVRVHFLGVRTDIPEILKTVDIVVLSSKYEGLSLSSIEGMASGNPFIASDVPGLHDVVEGAGLLFDYEDEETLAKYIFDLITNSEFRNKVATDCLNRSKQFGIDKMVDEHISLYKSLLKNA